jgi:predicted outer membrane repeat protein
MQNKLLVLLLVCFAAALAAKPTPPPSASYYISLHGIDVNNTACTAASPCQTISHCLSLGPTGSDLTISIAAGIYDENLCGVAWDGNSSVTYNSITITGPSGELPVTTINCANSVSHFQFSALAKTTVTLSFLTLMRGMRGVGENGGCVYASNIEQLNLTNVQFTGCIAGFGGALYSDSLTVISNSRFTRNQAGTEGGALYIQSLTSGTSIVNSGFFSNTAGMGGAIYLFGGFLTFTSCNVSDNNATDNGGGLYLATPTPKKAGTMTFTNSNFTNNTAGKQGGGVFAENLNHTFNIFGALFTDNWSGDGLSGDANIACNSSAMQFCYACTAKDCLKACGASDQQSCSQNSTSLAKGGVLCYGSHYGMCSDVNCVCKVHMSKVEKILIAVICVLLVVGVVLITVDIVRYIIRRRREKNTYTPIK